MKLANVKFQTFHRLSGGQDSIRCSDLTVEGIHKALENNVKYWVDHYSNLRRRPTDLKDVKIWDKVGLDRTQKLIQNEGAGAAENYNDDDEELEYEEEIEETYEIPDDVYDEFMEEKREQVGLDSKDEL